MKQKHDASERRHSVASLTFESREATTGNTSALQATKPLTLASPFECLSHVTSHHIPEMESLLARASVSRL